MALAIFYGALKIGRLTRADAAAFAALVVGVIAGPQRFAPFEVLFVTAFKPILAFFVLEMGLLAAMRLPELKKNGLFICVAAVVVPLRGGALGGSRMPLRIPSGSADGR